MLFDILQKVNIELLDYGGYHINIIYVKGISRDELEYIIKTCINSNSFAIN